MSYVIASAQGEVGFLASVQGLNDVVDFVERVTKRGPLTEFLETGQTENIPEVIKELGLLIPYATNLDVKATLTVLRNNLEKAQPNGWAMISE